MKVFIYLFSGFCAMFISMGIGRFAYTPALPFMIQSGLLTPSEAGFIASVNYAGYLFGAVAATFRPPGKYIYVSGLVLSVLSTWFMGYADTVIAMSVLRFISGVSSAAVFIFASSRVIAYLVLHKKGSFAGLLYSGIGAGMAASSLAAGVSSGSITPSQLWILFGIICLVLTPFCFQPLRVDVTGSSPSGAADNEKTVITLSFVLICAAYFLQGAGYIITGTFLAEIFRINTGSIAQALTGWAVVGISAVFSNLLWTRLGGRFGVIRMMALAYIIQALGILPSAFATSASAAYFSALIFGGTMLGIVALTLTAGREITGGSGHFAVGFLTVLFSVGQMSSPWAAGVIAEKTGSYSFPLYASSGAIFAGGLLCIAAHRLHRRSS